VCGAFGAGSAGDSAGGDVCRRAGGVFRVPAARGRTTRAGDEYRVLREPGG